ncbi:MAG TPA: C4-type zinc ribbon domain-containing protein [Planctomycetota bacterium]|nr:C4-type zinc ribbon domain-containing protein [Planctomycetota bacterium]
MRENSSLENIKQLHKLDCKLIALQKKHEELPKTLHRLEQAVLDKEKALREAEGHSKALRSRYDQRDLDLKGFEAQIKKLEGQLGSAKTNKEYSIILSEIATNKADVAKVEDDMLLAMETVDQQQRAIEQCKAAVQAAKQDHNAHKDEIKAQQAEVDAQLARLREERKTYTEKLTRDLLHQYERILQKRGPTAVVPVIDLSCQGCFMKVTPEVQAQLLKNETIVYCKTCSRIMYMV